MDAVKVIGFIALVWFVFGAGMLYAFWPINDEETSTTHKTVTFIVMGAIIAGLFVKVFE